MSWLEIGLDVTQAADLSFFWRADSEQGFDVLRVLVDGVEVGNSLQRSGMTPWTLERVPLGAGVHLVRFEYEKDNSVSIGGDLVRLDDIAFPPGTAIVPPPVASFTASPNPVSAGSSVTFTDTSTVTAAGTTGTAVPSYSWDFGDGTGSAQQHPVHVYAAPGTYTATLTVRDAGG
ncbi:MAG: hypothetical protein KatS3mg102_1151 [Planctomycetota bacterium]|nr:MAG: hypothetical protein KatS3mg102_1151 [Planctomycetota bacterium]